MKSLASIAFVVSLGLFGSPAQAEFVVGFYTGVVDQTPYDNGYFDHGNTFGLGANADLAGLPISGVFYYDPVGSTQPCSSTLPVGTSACTLCYPTPSDPGFGTGCNYYQISDLITATIEDHTIAIFGSYNSELSLTGGGSVVGGLDPSFALLAVNNAQVDIGLLVRTMNAQFSLNEFNPDSPDFSVINPDQYIGQLFLPDSSGFNFSITQLVVRPVPEPPTLPVLLSALGFLGLILLRGRSRLQ